MLTKPELIAELDSNYPDWREWGLSPLDAGIEAGLIDNDDLALLETPELEFER
jgi:hypothetical protein